jgi:hypothetical protein
MSGLVPAEKANAEVLACDGVHKMSTFYGYYMLIARAMAGDYQGAMNNIREYWGAMLDLGATTFWEDFDIGWMKNAARIDAIVPEDKTDVHRTYGGYCYEELLQPQHQEILQLLPRVGIGPDFVAYPVCVGCQRG